MGKAIKSSSNSGKPDEKNCGQFDPLRNISGLALEMEDDISDAIAIARTAKERSINAENEGEEFNCSDALGLILYRLVQVQECHALIVKNAPYSLYAPGLKERLS